MKIVFMGSPEFAIPSLEKLLNSNYSVELVVSAPDKERGRGKKILPTPVKEFALSKGLKVLTPLSLKEDSFIKQLKEINADLFVVVAFRILPREVFTIPSKGSFNLHASLLPKYRGAAPIQWALINGEKETGVTTFFLEESVDTGNIILQEKIKIEDEDNFGSLHDKLMNLGADVVLKTVELINSGNYQLIKQDDSLASPAPKITKELCRIDWSKSAREIHNLVRGLSPHPCAFFEHQGKIYKVYKTQIVENIILEPSKILQTKKEIFIGTNNGTIQILELQAEGRKRMTAEEFLRGYSLL
ncbi:MAG: methionyl-tRNA formyltransferase [Melioribacter sp.]|uniref:methionyl-tRNA formyltransferase n=1 Tax=Rosettibacter primus TaxID=3111523 RepID=UPI00247BAEFF|nr:methionyl-tRNA formyltransferase [Melioribacter sp.]